MKITTLIVLTGVGGYVDAVSYLGLGRVFTAAMTGNTILMGLAAAQRDWSAALRSAVALVGFVAGVALGQIIVGWWGTGARWPRAVGAGLAVELAFLSVLAVGWYLAGPTRTVWMIDALIAVSALAMGTQSATALRLGVATVSTTYVTGTLTSLTAGTIEWLRSPPRDHGPAARALGDKPGPVTLVYGPAVPAVAWLVYAAGALVGGVVLMLAPVAAPLPAILVVAALAVLDGRAGTT